MRPYYWTKVQTNRASALRHLGERLSDASYLEEAAAGYRAALEELSPERTPGEWATAKTKLGSVLAILGQRTDNVGWLTEATVAFRAVLEERLPEGVLCDRTAIQINLGGALGTIGNPDRRRSAAGGSLFRLSSSTERTGSR